jgi:hypothetical protein
MLAFRSGPADTTRSPAVASFLARACASLTHVDGDVIPTGRFQRLMVGFHKESMLSASGTN